MDTSLKNRLGKLRSKYLIADVFGYSGFQGEALPIIWGLSRSLRKLEIESLYQVIDSYIMRGIATHSVNMKTETSRLMDSELMKRWQSVKVEMCSFQREMPLLRKHLSPQ